MAVLKERLNRKNASGGYDTIYLETSSDIVIRPDGTTVEATLTTIKNDLTQVQNDLADVGGDIQQQVTTIITGGNAKHASTHASGGSDPITPGAIGALSSGGTAAAATKLATSRTIQTNLGSTSAARFNGTTNVSPGVTGTLGLGNGGTGKTTAPLSLYALINGSTTITGASLADTDVIGVGDVSAATGKKVTIAELKSIMGGVSGPTVDAPAYPSSIPAVGSYFTWLNQQWLVVHKTADVAFVCLRYVNETTKWSDANAMEFAGGIAWQKCTEFAAGLKLHACNYVVPMMGGYAWLASYDQLKVKGGFDYFNSSSRRIATNTSGSAQRWWTSSPHGNGGVYYVHLDGDFSYYNPEYTYGFRPFVALRL